MKYIFFDIDGTLTSYKKFNYVLDSTYKAIEELKQNGHHVYLATGRAAFRALDFAKENHFDDLVCEGGHCLIKNHEVVEYEPIDQEACHIIIRKCLEKKLALAISIEDSGCRICLDDYSLNYFNQIENITSFMNVIKGEYHGEIIRRLFVENRDDILEMIPEINRIGHMQYQGGQFIIVEADDKYLGISKMVLNEGGSLDDIVLFGDGINDIKAFKKAAFTIAMGNAVSELKAISDYVTDDSDSDGIYNACKKMGWI